MARCSESASSFQPGTAGISSKRFLPSVIDAPRRRTARATGAAVEIVVVDDGSTDDSVAWMAEQSRTCGGAGCACVATSRRIVGFARGLQSRRVGSRAHPLVAAPQQRRRARRRPRLRRSSARFATDRIRRAPLVRGPLPRAGLRHRAPTAGTGQAGRILRAGSSACTTATSTRDGQLARLAVDVRQRRIVDGRSDTASSSSAASITLFAPFYFEDVELSYRAWKRGLDGRLRAWRRCVATPVLIDDSRQVVGRPRSGASASGTACLLHWIASPRSILVPSARAVWAWSVLLRLRCGALERCRSATSRRAVVEARSGRLAATLRARRGVRSVDAGVRRTRSGRSGLRRCFETGLASSAPKKRPA